MLQGPKGVPGDPGLRGEQGVKGDIGRRGKVGHPGLEGPKVSLKDMVKSLLVQWNLLIRTPSGPVVLSFVERLSSFRGDFL